MTAVKKRIETPLNEITLRRYEKPYNLPKRELVTKLCLSLGLLQPGDSRDIIVDILYVMLATRNHRKLLSSYEIREQAVNLRREQGLALLGIADSNIRRQLKRLRDVFLIEKVKNSYRITEFESLERIFNEKIEAYTVSTITGRIKEYLKIADEQFPINRAPQ